MLHQKAKAEQNQNIDLSDNKYVICTTGMGRNGISCSRIEKFRIGKERMLDCDRYLIQSVVTSVELKEGS